MTYTLLGVFEYNLEQLKEFVDSNYEGKCNNIHEYRYMCVFLLYNNNYLKNKDDLELINNVNFPKRMLQVNSLYALKHSLLGVTTITFSECVENHAGMQKIGSLAEKGFQFEEIKSVYDKAISEGKTNYEFYDLSGPEGTQNLGAAILIIRNGIDFADELFQEQNNLDYDKKAFMKGRVVNKIARHNLCFADFDQEADFENGKGTIVNFNKLPYTSKARELLPNILGEKANNLFAEGNYYYDINSTYIGKHNDLERRRVVGVRLGNSFPLYFEWYTRFKPVGEIMKFDLNHGDMYVMTEKATGNDGRKSSILTLKHFAGLESVLKAKKVM